MSEWEEGKELVRVSGEQVHETDKGLLFKDSTGEEIWLPKSQIEDVMTEDDGKISLEIPRWLAEEKGLA